MDPLDIIRNGILLSFVPEDRFGMGLVGGMCITDNIKLRTYRKGPGPFADRAYSSNLAGSIVSELEVVTPDVNAHRSAVSPAAMFKRCWLVVRLLRIRRC